jgi:hypothetical protein
MKPLRKTPFLWLIITGIVASVALITEEALPLSQDIHFLLQFLWLGVVSAALLAFAIHPVLTNPKPFAYEPNLSPDPSPVPTPLSDTIEEWYDEDRIWMQEHLGSATTEE